ncbi:uncharacterized protein DUF4625 [Tenacibaculum adriaticum]|uniref:Uncharacterized protein DUF4625 n=1 Tax=Tenacibaculum adriaticum TaxID=413713 RepID=A0A5S5DZK8_9FLAO|nr:DUF4625 domain-containing protein [Tenacibaculum adriaticum]TYQ00173.1 uncharacterized protein DUF4625 [Tenacibaculum adriaticum]
MTAKFNFLITIVFSGLFLWSCSSDDSDIKDETKPEITINYNEGFPQSCTELVRGETYHFRAMVTDDMELASYSLDIHNNFDHHTHDDQGAQCELDPIKQAVNPMIYMENFSIENGLTSYEIDITVTIPNDVDAGDYHCAYSVTDKTGWQSRTSIDIKIIE